MHTRTRGARRQHLLLLLLSPTLAHVPSGAWRGSRLRTSDLRVGPRVGPRTAVRAAAQCNPLPLIDDGADPDHCVVFLRHGESIWNHANRFTGWTDVPLSPKGEQEALLAGDLLQQWGFRFDVVYCSYLQRTTRTAELVLGQLDQGYDPAVVCREWRLNERMYGALTGLNKREIADEYGADQFDAWVRDPPPLDKDSIYYPGNDPLYRDVPLEDLPLKESFEDTMDRVVPLWESVIKPEVTGRKKRVLVISSRNTIRALLMHISDIPTKDLLTIDIPNGIPLVYEIYRDCLKTIDSDSCNFGIDGPFVPQVKRYGSD